MDDFTRAVHETHASGDRHQDVSPCERCLCDHPGLLFVPFQRLQIGSQAEAVSTHWALCPTTGEPILLRVVRV